MPEISRTHLYPKDIDVTISEIRDGIYRIAGFVEGYGITFNQFLIDDEHPTLIHTGPVGMYQKIEEKVKEVFPIEKLAYVAFLLNILLINFVRIHNSDKICIFLINRIRPTNCRIVFNIGDYTICCCEYWSILHFEDFLCELEKFYLLYLTNSWVLAIYNGYEHFFPYSKSYILKDV